MKAIYKRELSACFRSPIGYLFCAIYLFFSGMYFNSVLSVGQSSEFPEIYYGMLNIVLLMLPLLTMRLFSEERKYKTDQILLTSPVNITPLVLGKFFSALTIYTGCTLFTLIYALVFSFCFSLVFISLSSRTTVWWTHTKSLSNKRHIFTNSFRKGWNYSAFLEKMGGKTEIAP